MDEKFVIDTNVGKLARWLRMMGYDAVLFHDLDDGLMVKLALAQGRIIVTKDSEFMKRRAVTSRRIKAVLVTGDNPERQMQKVIDDLKLNIHFRPFTRCLECNAVLLHRDRNEIEEDVPSRVYEKQDQYMECPDCHRLFWQGTHWEDMCRKLQQFESQRSQVAEGDRK